MRQCLARELLSEILNWQKYSEAKLNPDDPRHDLVVIARLKT